MNYKESDRFYFSIAGFIIPAITGSISFISSSFIILFILRSKSNTVYHRLLFILSSADAVTSVSIALGTIPMPKDVIYPFAGPSYGTIATCEAQGVIYMIGNGILFCMNGILNIYYCCSLRYHMRDKTFSKYIEPVLVVGAIVAPVFSVSLRMIRQGLMNPSVNDSFCTPDKYPTGCSSDDNPKCRGGNGNDYEKFVLIYMISLGMSVGTLIITMGLIVHNFYRSEKNLKKKIQKQLDEENGNGEARDQAGPARDIYRAEKMTRVITKQALMYVSSFFFTWTFTFVTFYWNDGGGPYFMQVLRMILQPLQGFFNMLIFFYHKVSTVRRLDEDLTVFEALHMIFFKPEKVGDVVAISSIDAIYEQETLRTMGLDPSEKLDVSVLGDTTISGGHEQQHLENSANVQPSPWRAKVYSGQTESVAGISYASSKGKSVRFDEGISYASKSLDDGANKKSQCPLQDGAITGKP